MIKKMSGVGGKDIRGKGSSAECFRDNAEGHIPWKRIDLRLVQC